MKNLKVLHIIDHMGVGGAQTFIKGVIETQSGNSFYLTNLRKAKEEIQVSHSNFIKNSFDAKFSFGNIYFLKKIIEEKNIDIVHCHLPHAQIMGIFMKILFGKRLKLIFHEHGTIFSKNFIYSLFLKIVKSKVDLFIAVSNFTKKNLISESGILNKKIAVLYNFVDLKKFKKKNIQKQKSIFTIGLIGRLSKVKSIDLLIDAFKILKDKGEGIRLLIVGSGPEECFLKNQAKQLGLEADIEFLGYQKNVEQFFPKFDVFVICSSSEACPMSLFEAMASGVPVVGSGIEQLKEFLIFPQRGFLFKNGSPVDLSDKIEMIRNGEGVKTIIKRGLEFSKENSLENYIEKLNKLYINL